MRVSNYKIKRTQVLAEFVNRPTTTSVAAERLGMTKHDVAEVIANALRSGMPLKKKPVTPKFNNGCNKAYWIEWADWEAQKPLALRLKELLEYDSPTEWSMQELMDKFGVSGHWFYQSWKRANSKYGANIKRVRDGEGYALYVPEVTND